MAISFWFVRHGETLFDRRGRIQGVCDTPLTEEGILQAKTAANSLKNIYFDHVYISSTQRSKETASYILKDRNIEPMILDDLHEVNYGRMEGSRYTSHIEEMRNCMNNLDFSPSGGESRMDIEMRINHAMRTIRENCKDGERVLIVSHGVYEMVLMKHLLGIDSRKFDQARQMENRASVPYGGIMNFKYENGRYSIVTMPQEPGLYKEMAGGTKTVHFYFMRHGECTFNVWSRMQGVCDSPLTENGYQQTLITADALKEVHFDHMYSSPIPRALKTAYIIAEKHYESCPCDELAGLKEVNVGDFEGIVTNDWKEEILDRHLNRGWADVGGESLEGISRRIRNTLNEIIRQAKDGDTVLLISHGNYYCNLLRTLFGIKRDELFAEARSEGRQAMPNGGIAKFDYCDGKYVFVSKMLTPEEFWNSKR